MKYASVAINLPVKNIFKQFTYIVPTSLDFLEEGWRVVVPFGAQMLEGFIVGEEKDIDSTIEYKEIVDTLGTEPWFDTEMLATAKWMSEYYMCSLGEIMRLFIPGKKSIAVISRYMAVPEQTASLNKWEEELYALLIAKGPMLRKEIETLDKGKEALKGLITKKAVALDYEVKQKIKNKTVNVYAITKSGREALEEGNKRLKAQMKALEILAKTNEAKESKELLTQGISAATVKTLQEKGWVVKSEKQILRDSYKNRQEIKDVLDLTDEQKQAIGTVEKVLENNQHKVFLLKGITGSGKTEVYLRLVEKVIAEGKQAIVLVPEIALTGQMVQRFKAWFGNKVAVAHSKLTASERADVWQRMRIHDADVLVGVRSAIFSPVESLGLIIIDEEHDSSYKEEERPTYNAKDVAAYRANMAKVPLLLGSATPCLESFYKAQMGEYELLELTKRPMAGGKLPTVTIVDMRKELQEGNKTVLSRALQEELKNTIEKNEQAIVLLNRRGFSTFVMCRDCGETITCPNCSVSLVYHASDKLMQCHYCGNTAPIPDECPYCHSRRIKFFGTGTEKAEMEINNISQNVKPIRMDQDSTKRKFAHEDILQAFGSGKYNVLLGTQMVAKGHDIPNVTLVGILSADSQLNLPDFRAGERTYALLTQAAGRAGRGDKPGKVVIQVYDAQNPIIEQAAKQDYQNFAKNELEVRKELDYPPFTKLLMITVSDKDQNKGIALAQKIVNFLQADDPFGENTNTQVLGPFPAIVPMKMNVYYTNILIKSREMAKIKEKLMASEFKDKKNVVFDIDPVSVV